MRIKVLQQAPQARERGLYRLCDRCRELCLCHEPACPNCGSEDISLRPLAPEELAGGGLIRCRLRFARLGRGPGA